MRQVPFGPVRFDVMQLKRKDRKTSDTLEELQEALQEELDNTLTSVSGNPITISDASNTNAEDFIVTLVPTQAGTGDPSPTNVRAISGLSSVDVVLNDNTITLSLGSTVYGGSVNFSTGVLTVDTGIVDMGTLSYSLVIDNVFGASIEDGLSRNSTVITDGVYCDTYAVSSSEWNQTSDLELSYGEHVFLPSYPAVTIHDNNYTEVADFKSSVSGHYFVYPLATPITTQLTAQQLRLLQGENELSTTGSSMSFKYQRDNLIGALKSWVLDQLS